MNKTKKDVIVVGFALFSIFFGAGNLIFPPFLGVSFGSGWLLSFVGFLLADVGIIFLTIIAVSKAGTLQGVVGRSGKRFGIILEFVMMLCLGPILAVPRTAAATFEISVLPFDKHFNSIVFSIIYFVITLLLTIRPTKVVDIIGKFLTPILLICLIIVIISGIIMPIGNPRHIQSTAGSLITTGINQGYQTMDAMGVGAIMALIMASLVDKGYKKFNIKAKMAVRSSIVACIGLAIIYCGLAYLGSTGSSSFDPSMSHTVLLVNIVHAILGNIGKIILAIIVLFACLTTSIGLTSVTSKYFSDISKNKIKYEYIVIIVCIVAALISNLGVDKLIGIAGSILSIIYPISIVLVIMYLFRRLITTKMPYIGAGYFTFIIALLNVTDSLKIVKIGFIHKIPLDSLSLNWILPAIVGAIIFKIIEMIFFKNAPKLPTGPESEF